MGHKQTLSPVGRTRIRHRFETKRRKSAVPELGTVLPSSPVDDSSWADSDLPEIKLHRQVIGLVSKISRNIDVMKKINIYALFEYTHS